jgi:hypothetical protein
MFAYFSLVDLVVLRHVSTGGPPVSLLQRARDLGRIMVTSDIRFRALAERWQAQYLPFDGLIFAHPLHVTIGQMVLDLELVAQALTQEEIRNHVLFLPL